MHRHFVRCRSENRVSITNPAMPLLSPLNAFRRHAGSSGVPPLLRAIALDHVSTVRALLIGGASLAVLHPQSRMSPIDVRAVLYHYPNSPHPFKLPPPLSSQIAKSEQMRALLLDPPEHSPWNSTGLFKPPQLKKKKGKSAAWSVERLRVTTPGVADEVSAVPMTEEEIEAARKAARAAAREKRRAATIAEANLGLTLNALNADNGNEEGGDADALAGTSGELHDVEAPRVITLFVQSLSGAR
jgi:hypothetical protein